MLAETSSADSAWRDATPAQQGIWTLDRVERLRSAYLVPSVVEFTGPVDHELLVAAVRRALSRHAALRSRFRLDVMRRRVEYRTDGDPPLVRLWRSGEHWHQDDLRRRIHEFCYSPFDLAAGPPARADIIRVSAVTTILVLTVHHIVFDGWSRKLVVAEIAEIYQATLAGREPGLTEPVHPAKALTAAPEEELASRIAATVERLRGAPAGVALPYDRRPDGDSPLISAVESARFDAGLTSRVLAVARREGCTAFMLAVAILAGTLARGDKQRDFLFAVVWPGRDDPVSHDVVGMFMNTVVLRVGLRERTTWRELLRAARAAALEAFTGGDVPLSAVAAELDKHRDMSRQPLTPVLINLADQAAPFELAPGVHGRYRPLDVMYSKWDLTVFVRLDDSSGGRQLSLTLDYPAQLFDPATISGLLMALRRSVIDLSNSPEETVLEQPDVDLGDPSVRLQIVRSAWQAVLGDGERADDLGFFEAGGDSLLLVALVDHLTKVSGHPLKTMDVFRAATINGQAALLAQ